MNELLLGLADDELVIGWRDSEWTGIAPMLEEDVAFSSIAQNEIGHARAVYELLADDADALAFDRALDDYRCAPLVEFHLLDWAHTIARRWLYEVADEIRITALMEELPLAAKINREEAYHRMHAEMWHERLRDEPRFRDRGATSCGRTRSASSCRSSATSSSARVGLRGRGGRARDASTSRSRRCTTR